jgi:hypothetical protein
VARVDMKRRLGGLARQLAQLLLTLPPNEPQRPHPALLYILLAEAVRILERSIPRPQLPRPPTSLFPQTFSPSVAGYTGRSRLHPLPRIRHLAVSPRARAYRAGPRDPQRRPAIRPRSRRSWDYEVFIFARALYRGLEHPSGPPTGFSCGLHRMTGNTIRPDGRQNWLLPLSGFKNLVQSQQWPPSLAWPC